MELPSFNNLNVPTSSQLFNRNLPSVNSLIGSQQATGQLFQVYNPILTRLDEINSNLRSLESRMNRIEQSQAHLEQIVRDRFPPPAVPARLTAANARIAVTQPMNSNKRPAESQEIVETKRQAITQVKDIAFQELKIHPQTSEELIGKYRAETIASSEVHIIDEDTRVVDDKGNILAIYIKQIDYEKHLAAINKLMIESKSSTHNSTTRGDAGGKFDASTLGKDPSLFTLEKNAVRARKEGSTYKYTNRHPSITLGYLSHDNKKNPCRMVGKNDKVSFNEIIPFLRDMGNIYAKFAPKQYKAQQETLEKHKILVGASGVHCQIDDTPFSTLTLNHSKDGKPTTFFHKDTNTLKGSLACLFVYGSHYAGGETAFPELLHPETKKPIAFNVRPGGVLIFNGNDLLHGNTPVKLDEGGDRVSFVAYTQQVLANCLRCKISNEEPEATASDQVLDTGLFK